MRGHIEGVRVATTPEGTVPVVLLGVEDRDELLPIFIGFSEASAIAHGLDATDIGRPLTHDLVLDVIEELGGRVASISISAIEDDTYIADLEVDTPRGTVTIDARPSDSLALAARTNAPIDVAPSVFEAGARPPDAFRDLSTLDEAESAT